MAADTQEIHRPGAFKQQNKPHKHGKHKSKGQLERGVKGILGSCLLIIDIQQLLTITKDHFLDQLVTEPIQESHNSVRPNV